MRERRGGDMTVLVVHGRYRSGGDVAFVVGVMYGCGGNLGDTAPQGYRVEVGEAVDQGAFDLVEDRRCDHRTVGLDTFSTIAACWVDI